MQVWQGADYILIKRQHEVDCDTGNSLSIGKFKAHSNSDILSLIRPHLLIPFGGHFLSILHVVDLCSNKSILLFFLEFHTKYFDHFYALFPLSVPRSNNSSSPAPILYHFFLKGLSYSRCPLLVLTLFSPTLF